MTNRPTAQTRLARRLQQETGLPYTQCLQTAKDIAALTTDPKERFRLAMDILRPLMEPLELPASVRLHGRTLEEWDLLRDAAREHIQMVARGRGLTHYSELNLAIAEDTGLRPFDFAQPSERTAIGALLGEISEETHAEAGIMLTVLVVQQATGQLGGGFYKLAAYLGLMPPNPTPEQKLQAQVYLTNQVYRFYDRRPEAR